MQLVTLSNKLKPITLAMGLLSSTSFVYSDIDAYSGILTVTTNSKIAEHIRYTDGSDSGMFMQKLRFQSYLSSWEKETMFLSSTKAIVENENFKSIVSMGKYAVPYIIEEIEHKPSTLVWALNMIYDRKITNNPNATITEACKLWVKRLKK